MSHMDRRQFCAASVTLLAVGAGTLLAARAGVARGQRALAPAGAALLSARPGLSKIIFDSRFAPGRALAVAAQQHGIAALEIRGDVTALWCHELNGHWARGGGAVGGLTTDWSLRCLEHMARDHWRQVSSRHQGSDGLVSWIISA
jgi:hypothetical protein